MLNLIPAQQKKNLEKEYKLRWFIVWAMIFVIIFTVSLILLLPSYILSRTKVSEATTQLDHTKRALEAQLQPNDLTQQLADAARNARDLKPFAPKNSVYSLMKIFESKPATIKINTITFTDKTPNPSVISLSGVAADRESLKAFGKLMEAVPQFGAVDLPVSNFAQDTNIQFNMSITIK